MLTLSRCGLHLLLSHAVFAAHICSLCDVVMQIHTMQYPDGALKATFDNSSVITQVVPTVYGASLIDLDTGTLLNPVPPKPNRAVISVVLYLILQCMEPGMSCVICSFIHFAACCASNFQHICVYCVLQ